MGLEPPTARFEVQVLGEELLGIVQRRLAFCAGGVFFQDRSPDLLFVRVHRAATQARRNRLSTRQHDDWGRNARHRLAILPDDWWLPPGCHLPTDVYNPPILSEERSLLSMTRSRLFALLLVLSLATAACGSSAGGSAGGSSSGGSYDTTFPLPPSVSNFTKSGDGSVNFQTTMSVTDAVAFYRDAMSKAGLQERTINTAITDTTFSLVFDGDPSGEAVVVQGVDLGNGTTNINIRHEKV
jgi:hypothetical protein